MAITEIENGEIFGRHAGSNCEWPADAMELVERTYSQPLTNAVVWDSGQGLPATASGDDLEITFGAGVSSSLSPVISTGDVKASNDTRKCVFPLVLPDRYAPGKSLTLDLFAGMKTTVSDTTATIDCEVFKSDGDSTSNSDICATAAQSINSLTHATLSFSLTTTGLVAGDNLWVLVSIAYNDGATGTAVIGQLGKFDLRAMCRG